MIKQTKKQRLQDQCRDMLNLPYSEGGIASCNEYNQFLCDTAPEMVQYMNIDGLQWLKERIQHIYDNMIESDKW